MAFHIQPGHRGLPMHRPQYAIGRSPGPGMPSRVGHPVIVPKQMGAFRPAPMPQPLPHPGPFHHPRPDIVHTPVIVPPAYRPMPTPRPHFARRPVFTPPPRPIVLTPPMPHFTPHHRPPIAVTTPVIVPAGRPVVYTRHKSFCSRLFSILRRIFCCFRKH